MNHKIDLRTKYNVFLGIRMWQCQRCEVWISPGSTEECDGKAGAAKRRRISGKAMAGLNRVLGEIRR